MVIPYNSSNLGQVGPFLRDYKSCRDYRYLFSSREWISSFLKMYLPASNFLIRSEKEDNYFSLTLQNGRLVFTGDPFNDFNGWHPVDLSDDFIITQDLRWFLERKFKISFQHLFESQEEDTVTTIKELSIQKHPVAGLKIIIPSAAADIPISKRISNMYNQYAGNLVFQRTATYNEKAKQEFLAILLSYRRQKLLTSKFSEYNPSFDPQFGDFMMDLLRHPSLSENLYIDYCIDRKTDVVLALALYFKHQNTALSYLRGHAQSSSAVSYGLILDYWSIQRAAQEGVNVIDLTRGNESYKYRLGGSEYSSFSAESN